MNRIFDIIDFNPTKYSECANCLKSDSKYREDLIYLAQGNKERSQVIYNIGRKGKA